MNKCCETCLYRNCATYYYDACMSNGMSNYVSNHKESESLRISVNDDNVNNAHIEQIYK